MLSSRRFSKTLPSISGSIARSTSKNTTPCSVENTEEDDTIEKKQHKKYDVATAKYNPFSVNNGTNSKKE